MHRAARGCAGLAGVLAVALSACANGATPSGSAGTATPIAAPTRAVTPTPAPTATRSSTGTARIVLTGDVMLGRGVASRTAQDPSSALAGVADVLRAADLAAGNLESPLTDRPHATTAGPYALEARPSAANLLAQAGFDAMSVATNHAGDAGPATVADTITALDAVRLTAVGGGADAADAFAPRILTVRGVRIALLAVDATGAGPRATTSATTRRTTAGVAWWDETRLHAAVVEARRRADVVIVGMHGGTEYHADADPAQAARAATLAGWGVDVVWGHHPHVVQPVRTTDPDGDGRPTLIATSLGNLLFDQHDAAANQGLVLELLAGPDGVRAWRRGQVAIAGGRTTFTRWLDPDPDPATGATFRDGSWWQLTSVAAQPVPATAPDPATHAALLAAIAPGVLLDAAQGDVTGDGRTELVAAFRRPYRETEVSRTLPRDRLVDAQGRSAHVGVYAAGSTTAGAPEGEPALRQVWVAGTVLEPVATLAACDGWLAVGLTTLEDLATRAGVSAWHWGGFGFTTSPALPGPGRPACADVDGDGLLDPLAVERTAS